MTHAKVIAQFIIQRQDSGDDSVSDDVMTATRELAEIVCGPDLAKWAADNQLDRDGEPVK